MGRTGRKCAFSGCENQNVKHRAYCWGHRTQEASGQGLTPLRPRGAPGGGTVTRTGYRRMVENGETFYEHRRVLETSLGRPLRAEESVHHVNGDRLDNRLANLELWSSWQPAGQRVEDKVAWAREILALYA